MMEEYRRMNSEDQTTLRRWLTLNAVVVGFIFTWIAMTMINAAFWGGESRPTNIAKYGEASQRAEAR
jgi:hypothetical protein